MASIGNDSGGRKRILFVAGDGKRRTVRLGRASRRQAETVRGHVENLVAAVLSRQAPPDETSRWGAALPDLLRKRVEAVGLLEPPEPEPDAGPTLGAFLGEYLAGRTDIKRSTRLVLGHTARCLQGFFGPDKGLADITEADADAWAAWLKGTEGLAPNTVRRRSGIAKQFFRAAVRARVLDRNPFTDLKSSVRESRGRDRFIGRDVTQKVIDACPDAEWRLIVALCRYGGLRCPSEVLRLTWADVHWAQNRFTVHSSKTEHHEGKGTRDVPLFPELVPYLRDVFEGAEPGTEHVVTRYDAATCENLRTQFHRIICKAAVEPWPKLFQNLRSTRETELAETFPLHVVCKWIGNSRLVAKKHYLQVTDEHFQKAARNPAQYLLVQGFPGREGGRAERGETPVLPPHTAVYREEHINILGDTGLEPVTSRV